MKTTVMVATVILLCLAGSAQAKEINMKAIAQIESSLNPLAYNQTSRATGLYQITPICLKDYNQYHTKNLTLNDMKNPALCYKVAYWYMNIRIPQLLHYYGHKDTIENRLTAYNAGIKWVGKKLPSETTNYIRKYNEAIK